MTEEKQLLQVQNTHVSRIISVAESGALRTVSLANRRTGREYIVPDSGPNPPREFAVQWNGIWLYGYRHAHEPADFVFVRSSQRTESYGSRSLEVFLVGMDGELEVRLTYEIYPDFPAVRKTITLTNMSLEPGLLRTAVWEDLALSPGLLSDLRISSGIGGQQLDASWKGSPGEDLAIAMNPAERAGYAVMNETPGPCSALEVNPDWQPRLRALYSSVFKGRTIGPGESFSTDSASLLLFDFQDQDEDATSRLHDYIRQVIGARRGLTPPLVYCSPSPPPGGGGGEWVESKISAAARSGVSLLCFEGGGMRRVGGFDVNVDAFPGGLGQTSHLLSESEMGLGLTLPLAALDPDCAAIQEHPEWLCRDDDGKPLPAGGPEGNRQMVCLASGYRDYLLKEIRELCERDQVNFLLLTGPALSLPRRCCAEGHDHSGAGDSALAIGRALAELGAELSEACPDLILGFDHDLWGEPNRLDLTCFKMADFCRVCDIPDRRGLRTPMEARRLFYRRALVFPPESMAMGSLRVDGANPVAAVASALAGFPLLTGLAERMSSGQGDWLRGVLGWHRALSRRVNFHERFHFLHGEAQALPGRWDGYAKLNRKGEGFLAVFRNGSPSSTHRFPLPGMDPAATYRLESVFRDRVVGIHSAHELAQGISFEVRHEDGADLVESRRVDG